MDGVEGIGNSYWIRRGVSKVRIFYIKYIGICYRLMKMLVVVLVDCIKFF